MRVDITTRRSRPGPPRFSYPYRQKGRNEYGRYHEAGLLQGAAGIRHPHHGGGRRQGHGLQGLRNHHPGRRGRPLPHRSGKALPAPRRGAGHAGHRALQEGQPQIPPREHRHRPGRRRFDRRREAGRHRRTLLRGERGADRGRGPGRQAERRLRPPGRRLQAPHLPLLLPGHGQRRHPPPPGGPGCHRTAHRHRDHVHR